MKLSTSISLGLVAVFTGISVFAQTSTPAPTYNSIRDGIFVAKCLTCHSSGQVAEDVPLDDYTKLMADGTIVVARDLANSSIIAAISPAGSHAPSMPPARSGIQAVTPAELATIKLWIQNGAIQQ